MGLVRDLCESQMRRSGTGVLLLGGEGARGARLNKGRGGRGRRGARCAGAHEERGRRVNRPRDGDVVWRGRATLLSPSGCGTRIPGARTCWTVLACTVSLFLSDFCHHVTCLLLLYVHMVLPSEVIDLVAMEDRSFTRD
jgi:hypothetical protein